MHLLLLVWLGTWGQAFAHWEPCETQCNNNFKRNDMLQQASLVNVCKRGCDLFTVALISNPSSLLSDSSVHPKPIPLIKLTAFKMGKNGSKSKEISVMYEKQKEERPAPSIINILTMNKHSSNSVTDPSSKTTLEPTSEPVQDHPAEANKETTTTKSLKKLLSKKSKPLAPGDIVVTMAEETPDCDEKKPNMNGRLEQAKHSCRHACVAAYRGAVEQEACVVGCHLQATTASLNPMKAMEKESEMPNGPMGMIKHAVFSFASRVGHLVHITWSLMSTSRTNVESPENKIQVYGSEGLTRRAQVPLFIGLRQSYNIPETQRSDRPNQLLKLEQEPGMNIVNDGFFHLPRPLDNTMNNSPNQGLPAMITIIKEESKHSFNHNINNVNNINNLFMDRMKQKDSVEEVVVDKKEQKNEEENQQHQLDLLECISRKSGLPRWLIAIAIFVSALVVLWLCFSLTAPPDDIKVVKTKVPPPDFDGLLDDDDEDYDDDMISCPEKKKLLARNDDVIKIRIENV